MFDPGCFGLGIGSTRWRAASAGAGVVTATPGWWGFASRALSTVRVGSWAEALSPNPAHRVRVASTRIVIREGPIRGVLRDRRRTDPRSARAAWNNGHNRCRQTAATGLTLEPNFAAVRPRAGRPEPRKPRSRTAVDLTE